MKARRRGFIQIKDKVSLHCMQCKEEERQHTEEGEEEE
jgi:hypothetical protein